MRKAGLSNSGTTDAPRAKKEKTCETRFLAPIGTFSGTYWQHLLAPLFRFGRSAAVAGGGFFEFVFFCNEATGNGFATRISIIHF